MSRRIRLIFLMFLGSWWCACANQPYRYGTFPERHESQRLAASEPQIERGAPNGLVDTLGSLFSLPSKLLLLSWRVDNHRISAETQTEIHAYLNRNELPDVKVRLNQYDPGGEWERLFANRDVSPFWRYTVGAISVAAYTVFPGRVFGGDNFNPFTNSIHLYSDLPAIALHEGGHAKDFASQRYKGSYAALRLLPLIPLIQEARATGDAIGYAKETGDSELERESYRVLYPAYGTYLGGEALNWIPVGSAGLGYAIQYGVVVPMHIVGRTRAWLVDEPEDALPSASGD